MNLHMKLRSESGWIKSGVAAALAVALPVLFAAPLAVGEEVFSLDLGTVSIGADRPGHCPVQVESASVEEKGVSLDGIKVTYEHFVDYRPPVVFPIEISVIEYNTLTFKIKFDDGKPQEISVMILDKNSQWSAIPVSARSTKLEDGWYQFRWDIINDPNPDANANQANPAEIAQIRLIPPFASVPENEKAGFTAVDLKFISGEVVQKGDAALYKRWVDYTEAYQPDYSDSSKYLLPPEAGRLKEPLIITKGGRAFCEIVVDGASDTEMNAATELQTWFSKISGAQIPIVDRPTRANNVKIFLGRTFAQPLYAADLATLESKTGGDGFAVRALDRKVFIFGAKPKGTMNGVFTFIENNTDIIWARPHLDFGTVYTKQDELKIVWADALEKPATHFRGWMPNLGGGAPFWMWADRNRDNFIAGDAVRNQAWGDLSEYGGGHNLHMFIPKGDPQYYPTVGGVKPEALDIWKHQICMSVPDLESTYANNVNEYIETKVPPGIDMFNIKIEDNHGVCECEGCTAPITLPDGKIITKDDPAFRSTQFFNFLNKVTEKVNEVYPELKIQTYGYYFTSVAPRVKLNPNIYVLVCPYVRHDHRRPLFAPVNDSWWQIYKGWVEATPNLVIREYYGIFLHGRPLAEVFAADLRSYLDLGIRNIGSEIFPDLQQLWVDGEIRGGADQFDLGMMDLWVINRLYWNPNTDVEVLRKYFIRRTFRDAAPEMERFFGAIRERWYTAKGNSEWGEPARTLTDSGIFPKRVDEMRKLLATATEKADHPVSRVLIGRVSEVFEFCVNAANNPTPAAVPRDHEIELMNYGWWEVGESSAYRTSIEHDNRVVSAVHIVFRGKDPRVGLRGPFQMGGRLDFSGRSLSFTLLPASKNPGDAPVPILSFTDSAEAVMESRPSAYKKGANGELILNWTPTGTGVGERAVDLTQIKWPDLRYPTDIEPGETVEFYLLDGKLSPKN
jgi:hypothetical protein